MKSFFGVLAASAVVFSPVAAHYRFVSLIANGAVTGQFQYVRSNTNSNSPVTDLSSPDLRCNVGGLASGAATQTASVAAGSTVGFRMDSSVGHPGPTLIYLGKAPSTAAGWDGSGANWFKIYELGADFSSGSLKWPSDAKSEFTVKIPNSTPTGEYLLRIEHIGLHVAGSAGGSQHYISCANLKITGGGSGNPPKSSIPGIYNINDKGLLVNIYYPPLTSYTPPGPSVWRG